MLGDGGSGSGVILPTTVPTIYSSHCGYSDPLPPYCLPFIFEYAKLQALALALFSSGNSPLPTCPYTQCPVAFLCLLFLQETHHINIPYILLNCF